MKNITLATTLALAALCPGAFLASSALGQNTVPFTVLHSFPSNGPDFTPPNEPRAGLTLGRDGRLYGTTYYGGAVFEGAVYAITNDGAFSVLSSFNQQNGGGAYPEAALTQGSDGLFYGTTTVSDYGPRSGQPGDGTVFSVTGGGALSILHIFHREAGEGFFPYGEVTQGSDGRYYGTTTSGGAYNNGTIFAVAADGTFTTLHSFNSAASDGQDPYAKLTLGRDGKLYGVTSNGGNGVDGTAFSITNDGQFTVLYRFSAANGGSSFPEGGLIQGSDGRFYGTTRYGGTQGNGTVYALTSTGAYTKLHEFVRGDGLGFQPRARLVQASDGRFYGTTGGLGGGDGSDEAGTIFSITADGVFHQLHVFNNAAGEGRYVSAELVQGTDGFLYGVAQNGGGAGDGGTVFKVGLDPATGVSSSTFFNGEVPLSNGVSYLSFPNGNFFGYYAYLSDPRYIYHFDLGYEYIFDAADGRGGAYLYDFTSSTFFYTSPSFGFPYLYDFSLNTVLYYYPDPNNGGRYNTNGVRYFYRFDTGQIFVK